MTEWFSTPDRDLSFTVAGWDEFGGEWNDVEKGDTPLESLASQYGDDFLGDVERITVHVISEAGDDVYMTLHGPFVDWDDIATAVDEAGDAYGIAS